MSTKNARKDPAWKYGVEHQVPAQGGKKGYKYIKCNFCSKVITGGVKRTKEHLGCTHKDVAPCDKVPPEVKEEILHYLKQFQEKKVASERNFEENVGSGAYYSGDGSVNPSSSSRGVRGPMDRFMGSARDNEDGSLPNEKMTPASAKEHRNRTCHGFPIGSCTGSQFADISNQCGKAIWLVTGSMENTPVKHSGIANLLVLVRRFDWFWYGDNSYSTDDSHFGDTSNSGDESRVEDDSYSDDYSHVHVTSTIYALEQVGLIQRSEEDGYKTENPSILITLI
ncbi:hypothetical protein E3N88_14690 [Mikania micrantha]|uniref:BED-type domain-containing protein n=1 Tax=Mikania micrantha TaxID=192012 RepID=A0A5N6P250_9ASTR|nr:hypothetical protein E3N88_14690 [Mikania micrantha]